MSSRKAATANAVRTSIGGEIERRRIAGGFKSIRALAAAAGVHHSALSRSIADQKRTPNLSVLQALCGPLGCTVADLLGELPSPSSAPPAPRSGIVMLDRSQLVGSARNPRRTIDHAAIAELAQSIESQGLLQNLVVRPFEGLGAGKGQTTIVKSGLPVYEIIAGHRRIEAIDALIDMNHWNPDLANIPCRIVEADDGAHLAMALIENLQRVDISPLDEAEAFHQLQTLDPVTWSTTNIAARIGKSTRHVQLRLALVTKLCEPAQEALRDGLIELAHARVLAALPPKEQPAVLKKIGSYGYRTGDELRNALTRDMPNMTHALFHRALYTGEIIEEAPEEGDDDQTTKLFAADRTQFDRLQDEVIAIEKAKLEKRYAWVEIKRGELWRYDYDYRTASSAKARAGAIIFIAPSGAVVIKKGVERIERSERASGITPERRKELEAAVAAEKEASAKFARALGDVVVADPILAMRLMAMNLILPRVGECLLSAVGNPHFGDDAPSLAWRGEIAPDSSPKNKASGLTLDQDEHQVRRAWRAIRKLDEISLGKLLAAKIAERLDIDEYGTLVSLVIISLAAQYDIPVPPHLLEDPLGPQDEEEAA